MRIGIPGIVVMCVLATSLQAEEAVVVVKASRGRQSLSKTAGNPTIITAADIEKLGYDNIVDVIKHAKGSLIRSHSGNAAQAEISMRGFGENSHGRVLVVVNGRKINRPDMAGINWLQVPLDSVERVEIEHGGNSVLYGDHAVAGVINIVTHLTAKEPTVKAKASVGSFGSDTENVGVAGNVGRLSYALDAGHQETDGYRERSGYSAWNVGGNLAYELNDTVSLTLGGSYSLLDFELPGDLTREEVDADREQSTSPDDAAENEYINLDAGVVADMEDMGRASFDVTFGRKDMVSDVVSWAAYADMMIDTFGILPQYSLTCPLFGRENSIVVGIDYYVDDMSVDRFAEEARTTETVAADVTKSTTGFYARDKFAISEDLIIGIGGRTERTRVKGKVTSAGAVLFDDSKTHDSQVFEVSAVYHFLEDAKLFAKYSTTYRYPFIDEQISYYGYGTDVFYQDIEAEKGDDLELGTAFGLCDNAGVELTAFLIEMDDEIAWNNATFRNENLDSTRHAGLEATANWQVTPAVALKADYTYTEATFTDGQYDGNDIPAAPQHQVAGRADVSLPLDLMLGVGVQYVGESYLGQDFENVGSQLGDYTVVDLSLRCTPGRVKGLDIYVAVDNVFDEEYSGAGYHGGTWGVDTFYPAPTRAFRGGASYRF